jgi:hypothetical protein
MKSSSESMPVICGDCGLLGAFESGARAAAEAILFLLDLVAVPSREGIASAAFLFFVGEEMVSVDWQSVGVDESQCMQHKAGKSAVVSQALG